MLSYTQVRIVSKANTPDPHHPEGTTAKRAVGKDPVRHVSRSYSAVDGPTQPT